MNRLALLLILIVIAGCSKRADKPRVAIGAKKFTESYLLAEMGVNLTRQAGVDAERKNLGSTPTLWLALTQGDIDAYPEYTGTITRQILKEAHPTSAYLARCMEYMRSSKNC